MISGEVEDPWLPLSVREGRAAVEEYQGPFEGVPEHLVDPLRTWLQVGVTTDLRRRVLLRLRLVDDYLLQHAEADLLNMVDAALNLGSASTLNAISGRHALVWLDQSLADGGSIYRVGDQGLERRIDAATRAQFDATLDLARNAQTPSGSAAMHLAEAWTKTYGVNPEPPAAVLLAVKAVEDVSIHLIIPKDDNATLGKVINALQAPGKWTFKPARDGNIVPVLELARFVWASPLDRHAGTATYSQTTLEQAEAIVQAAIVLVRWFAEEQIVKVTT